jgi:hypothetical protein
MKTFRYRLFAFMTLVCLMIPVAVWAGGGKAEALIHVADTRMLSGVYLYFANLYNENLIMFGVWTVVVITALGSGLGFFMDMLMSHTGLDLTSREIRE